MVRRRENPLDDTVQSRLLDWLLDHETCLASRNLALSFRNGHAMAPGIWPRDVHEFRRCVDLIETVPRALEGLWILAEGSDTWLGLKSAWQEMERSLRDADRRGEHPARTQETLNRALEWAAPGRGTQPPCA